MSNFSYCEECLRKPKSKYEAESEFYDFRFDFPVCLDCVEKNGLQPLEEEATDE